MQHSPFTLLEQILVQLLIQWMNSFGFSMSKEYQMDVLIRAGLTEQQAEEARGDGQDKTPDGS